MEFITSVIDLTGSLERAAAGALADAAKNLQVRLPRAKSVLKLGLPWQEIVLAVQDLTADLVIMGSHGRHGLERVLMGSVAEKVVRLCPVPVLTVRGRPEASGSA